MNYACGARNLGSGGRLTKYGRSIPEKRCLNTENLVRSGYATRHFNRTIIRTSGWCYTVAKERVAFSTSPLEDRHILQSSILAGPRCHVMGIMPRSIDSPTPGDCRLD